MLKLKFRVLFLLLGVIILLFAFVGCNYTNDPSNTTADTTTSNPEGDQTPNVVRLRAETYIQQPALSWTYSFDVKVEGDKVYVNDSLYEKSTSDPPIILYPDGFLSYADSLDRSNNNQEFTNTLTKIQRGEPFCVLETKQDRSCGSLLSVYEIDGVYYFVRFFDTGEVMRIHRAIIANDSKDPEQQQPTGVISFRADPYLDPAVSSMYWLRVKVEDDKIYLNDVLYEKSSSAPPAIVYTDAFLVWAESHPENENQEVTNTLTKIKNGEPCCVLEATEHSAFGDLLSVYEVDGVYYFVRFYEENGNVTVLWLHYYAPIK